MNFNEACSHCGYPEPVFVKRPVVTRWASGVVHTALIDFQDCPHCGYLECRRHTYGICWCGQVHPVTVQPEGIA
jgi:hypothetical protein